MHTTDSPRVLVSLEQAASLLGVPGWILRRCVSDGGTPTMPSITTAGSHLRVPLDPIIESAGQIVQEVAEWRSSVSKSPESEGLDLSEDRVKKAANLRDLVRQTIDANTAATMLGVSRPTLRRWEREGKIVGVRPIGPKQVRYYKESIEALLHAGELS